MAQCVGREGEYSQPCDSLINRRRVTHVCGNTFWNLTIRMSLINVQYLEESVNPSSHFLHDLVGRVLLVHTQANDWEG